jgi:hypothetical protein
MRSTLFDHQSDFVHLASDIGVADALRSRPLHSWQVLCPGGRSAVTTFSQAGDLQALGRQITTFRGKVDDIRIPEREESDCRTGLALWPGRTNSWGGGERSEAGPRSPEWHSQRAQYA